MARKVECRACGAVQDPDHPRCIHMAGAKGGKRTAAAHGREFFEKIGQKGGKVSGKRRAA